MNVSKTIFLALVIFGYGCVPKVEKRNVSEDEALGPGNNAGGKKRKRVANGSENRKSYSRGSRDTKMVNLLWYLDRGKYAAQKASVDINLAEVHSWYRGEGQIVIVSDNRVDLDHPDLQANANVAKSKDYTAGTDSKDWLGKMPRNTATDHAHGTLVASEIAMVKDNSEGMFGVAPEVELRGYNFVGSDQKIVKLIDTLGTGVKGNVTFNYSFGNFQSAFAGLNQYAESYFQYFSEKRSKANIVWVKASGNWYAEDSDEGSIDWKGKKWFMGNSNFDQINTYPYIIMVGALSTDGERAAFSSPGSNLWITAPGTHVSGSDIVGCSSGYSTDPSKSPVDKQGNNLDPNCDYTINKQGTSVSTPLVAGAVALLREVCPDTCTWREIKHALAKTAIKAEPFASDLRSHPIGGNLSLSGHVYQLGWRTNSAGYHFHNHYGFGMLDIKAAINYLENKAMVMPEPVNTLGPDGKAYYRSGSLNQAIPDRDAGGVSASLTVDAHNVVIEHVLVEMNITHPRASDLGIELTSPSGMVSQLTNINSGIKQVDLSNVYLGSNAFYGESGLGTWTLKVIDGSSGETGTLDSWSLKILGHQNPRASLTVPSGVVDANLDGSNNLSWELPADTSNLRRVEVCIYDKERECSFHDWIGLPLNSGQFQVSHYKNYAHHGLWQPINSGIKKVRIRVVDNDENASLVSSYSFDFQ